MTGKKILATLVDDKNQLDRVSRTIELYRSMYRGDDGVGNPVFDESHRVFDARVTVLTEDERW